MAQDYYQLLGVSRTASPDEIKKAFRQKAHQLHPDKSGGDAEKFKAVNEAYQVLSNPAKRQQYDQFGQTFTNQGGPNPFQGFGGAGFQGTRVDFGDLGDIFGDMFGFGTSARQREPGPVRGRDIEGELTVPFRQAVFGGEQTIELKRPATCTRCDGRGAEPGTAISRCATCDGSGQVRQTQRTILGAFQSVQTCPNCDGTGQRPDKKCKRCQGEGREFRAETVRVKIPAGIDAGQRIRLSGKGEAGQRGAPAGDLYLQVLVQPDKIFQRDGEDLLSSVEIPLSLAVLGGSISVDTIDGPVEMKIPAGTKTGRVLMIADHGVPRLRGNGRGDHRVTITVAIPSKVSAKAKKLFKELQDEGL